MLLRQLTYFAAVVECGSFTEAAERCYITQSAVSQQIRALEQELGVTLLERRSRGFELTAAGRYLYEHGRALLDEAEALCRETRRAGSEEARTLRIGCPRSYSSTELPDAVSRFAQEHPDTDVEVVPGTHEELFDLLRSAGVDLALSDQRRAFSDEYVNLELPEAQCMAELPGGHGSASAGGVELAEMRGTPCILVAPRSQRGTEQDFYRRTLGFTGSFLFAGSLEEARLMVAGRRGFLPVDAIGTLSPPDPSVVRVPLLRFGRPLTRRYCLFRRAELTSSRIESFAGLLKSLIEAKI